VLLAFSTTVASLLDIDSTRAFRKGRKPAWKPAPGPSPSLCSHRRGNVLITLNFSVYPSNTYRNSINTRGGDGRTREVAIFTCTGFNFNNRHEKPVGETNSWTLPLITLSKAGY